MNKKALFTLATVLTITLLLGLQSASAWGYSHGYGSSYTHVKKTSYNSYYEKTSSSNPWGHSSHVKRFNYGPYRTGASYYPYQKHYSHAFPTYNNHPSYHLTYYPAYKYPNNLAQYWHSGYHAPTYFEKTVVHNY